MGRHTQSGTDPWLITADIATLNREATLRDMTAGDAARELIARADPGQRWGQLAELGAWLCGAQGQCPPRPLDPVQVIAFCDSEQSPSTPSPLLEQEPLHLAIPLETDHTEAFAWGRQVADEVIDGGAELLIPISSAAPTVAATLCAGLLGYSAVEILAPDLGLTDHAWTAAVTDIRNRLYAAGPNLREPERALPATGSPQASAITGLLIQAALRRTPTLIDGRLPLACALAAHKLVEDSAQWWLIASRPATLASQEAVIGVRGEPILDLGLELDDGTGALLAAQVLRAAGRLLAQSDTLAPTLADPLSAPDPGTAEIDPAQWNPDGES